MDMRACNSIQGGQKIASAVLTFPSLWMENNTEQCHQLSAGCQPVYQKSYFISALHVKTKQ